jgi:PAS domain S-box-containing protein
VELYGFSRDELLGHRFSLICSEDCLEEALSQVRTLFNADDISPSIQSTVKREHGSEIAVEAGLSFLLENGWRSAVLSMECDVTEHRRAEADSHQRQERYRTLPDNLPNSAVVLFDRDFTVLLTGGTEFSKAGIDHPKLIDTAQVGSTFPCAASPSVIGMTSS